MAKSKPASFKSSLPCRRHRAGISFASLRGYPRNSAKLLVKRCCFIKHVVHVGDRAGVPRVNILVEGGVAEQVSHGRDGAGIPFTDVYIESIFTVEHPAHVGHGTSVPFSIDRFRDLRLFNKNRDVFTIICTSRIEYNYIFSSRRSFFKI